VWRSSDPVTSAAHEPYTNISLRPTKPPNPPIHRSPSSFPARSPKIKCLKNYKKFMLTFCLFLRTENKQKLFIKIFHFPRSGQCFVCSTRRLIPLHPNHRTDFPLGIGQLLHPSTIWHRGSAAGRGCAGYYKL